MDLRNVLQAEAWPSHCAKHEYGLKISSGVKTWGFACKVRATLILEILSIRCSFVYSSCFMWEVAHGPILTPCILTGLFQGASVGWRSASGLGSLQGKLDTGVGLSPDNSVPECLSERGEHSNHLPSPDSGWGWDIALEAICCSHLLQLAPNLHWIAVRPTGRVG